jgi:hypothetical protein
MTESEENLAGPKPDRTRVRFLTPEVCRVHLGSHGALHVTVKGERIYGGVYAAYAFPVRYPEGYISLIHAGGEGGEVEIGIIRDLKQFPEADGELVREALRRRYFIHTIAGIRRVGWKYGYVAMDVDTDKGPVSFMMPWRHDNAVDYGQRGKVLIDLDENRYLIPDLEQLPARQRNEFRRYIYW